MVKAVVPAVLLDAMLRTKVLRFVPIVHLATLLLLLRPFPVSCVLLEPSSLPLGLVFVRIAQLDTLLRRRDIPRASSAIRVSMLRPLDPLLAYSVLLVLTVHLRDSVSALAALAVVSPI